MGTIARQLGASLAAQIMGRIVTIASSLALFLLVARLLGATALGQFSFVTAYVGIAAALADLGTTNVLGPALIAGTAADRARYFGNFLVLRLILALLATGALLVASFFVPTDLVWPTFVCTLATPLVAARFFDPVFQIAGRPWYSLRAALWQAGSSLPAALVAMLLFRSPIDAALGAFVGANVAYCVAAWLAAAKLLRPRFEIDWSTLTSIARVAAPIGISAIFVLLNNRIDVFMLAQMRGERSLGLYMAGYRFLDLGTTMAMTVTSPLLPVLSRMARNRPPAGVASYHCVLGAFLAVALPGAALAPMLSPALMTAVFGPAYAEAAPVLDILAWAFVAAFYDMLTFVFLLSIGRIRHAHWNSIAAATVNVATNFILIPRLGIVGAAWATLASFLCLAAGQWIILTTGGIAPVNRGLRQILAVNAVFWTAILVIDRFGGPALIGPALVAYGLLAWRLRMLPWQALVQTLREHEA